MSRTAQHSVNTPFGRIRFSLIRRPEADNWYCLYKDLAGARYVQASTRCTSQVDAIAEAERIVTEAYTPQQIKQGEPSWAEVAEVISQAIRANGLRQDTLDDYLDTIRTLQLYLPTHGPHDVTLQKAAQFKLAYAQKCRPQTVASRINKLRCLWSRWLVKELHMLKDNPWTEIKKPKVDEKEIRLLGKDEVILFLAWLDEYYRGWPLPRLFFTVKALTGCRLRDFCELRSSQLEGGCIVWNAAQTKGRKERTAWLPAKLFEALVKLSAGHDYLWGSYLDGIRSLMPPSRQKLAGSRKHGGFEPKGIYHWVGHVLVRYRKLFPNRRPFSSHDFRRRAMTQAVEAGFTMDEAAVAFGTNPQTMRQFYVRQDKSRISREVMERLAQIQGH